MENSINNNEILDMNVTWKLEFESKLNALKEAVRNTDSITLICTNNSKEDELLSHINPDKKPELITINGSSIKSKIINKEFINFILTNADQDIRTITLPSEAMEDYRTIGLLSRFKELREINITGNHVLTKEEINELLSKTTVTNITSETIEDTDIKDLPSAIKIIGESDAIYYDDLLISNDKEKPANAEFFYSDDIYYNIDTILTMIKHFNIDIKNKHLNVISLSNQNEGLTYDSNTKHLDFEGNVSLLDEIINSFKQRKFTIESLNISLPNYLNNINNIHGIIPNITITVNNKELTIEEYEQIYSKVLEIVEILDTSNLSQIEKITYLYQLTGDDTIIREVLKAEDIKYEEFNDKNITRVDDDKYDIHGVYVVGPYAGIKNEISNISNYHQIIAYYLNFMNCKDDYKALYAEEDTPAIFKNNIKLDQFDLDSLPRLSDRVENGSNEIKTIQTLFDKDEYGLINSYINKQAPSIEVFRNAMMTIKQEENKRLAPPIEEEVKTLGKTK